VIKGMHHAGLSTRDAEALTSFYCDLLGFTKVFEMEWETGNEACDIITGLRDSAAKLCMIKSGDVYLEIFEYRNPLGTPANHDRAVNDVGIAHICIDVEDNVTEYERLSAAGVTFHGPPQEVAGVVRVAYARDPDGNVVELQEILDRSHPLYLAHGH